MKYDLRKMLQLVAVARAGSFSRAATQLHITQPALSRNVAAIERELGVKVFDRGRGGASVTTVGSLVVAEIETLLEYANRLDHNLKHFGSGDAGNITFGLGPMVGSLLLSDMAIDFLEKRPGLHLRPVIMSAPELLRELLNHHIELFVCGREQLPEGEQIAIEAIASIPIARIVRGDHPLATRPSVSADQVLAYPVLSGVELPPALSAGGEVICDNYHILRDTVQRCDGVWLTTPRMVQAELAAGTLVVLDMAGDESVTATEICLVHRQGYSLSPAAQHVRHFVRQFLLAPG